MSELDYPFDTLPNPGHVMDIAPGLRWIRMPLPMALDHINLYLLEDNDGWWVVDTGMAVGDTQQHWQTIFDSALEGKPVKGVIVTHMHPDHVGMAGWICEEWEVPLYMSFGEYYNARAFNKMTADDLGWTSERYFRACGLEDSFFMQMKKNFHGYSSIVHSIPGAFRRLEEGTELLINGNPWKVIIGRGHSPEHACLHCESLGILISGDQVIPKITSNVSVMPAEPEANPLADWFDSLHKFLLLPEDTLVLPAHNEPFTGLHPRLRFLLAHHEDHLLALEEACVTPQSAVDLLTVLFARKLDESQMTMAIGECVAHLHYLLAQQKLGRTMDEQGVYRYLSIDPTLAERARPGTHSKDDEPMVV